MTISKRSGTRRAVLAGLLLALLVLACGTALAQQRSPAASSRTGSPPSDETIKPNLDNVGLKDFIRFVSRFTGRNIVYREDVIPNVKVSIFSQEPITEADLMAMFNEVLASANLAAIARDGALYILPEKQSRELEHSFTPQAGGRGPQEELITTVYRITGGMTAKTAEAVLKPVASTFGVVMSIPQASAVLIKDTRSRVDNMVKLIRNLEAIQPRWKVEVFPLTKAKAENAAKKLTDFYKQLMDHGRDMEPPLILPVEWTNIVIAAGDPVQLDNIRTLLTRMDFVGEGNSGLKVYKLQNAKAESAVKVLEGLLSSTKAAAGGGQGGQGGQGQQAVVQPAGPYQVSADTNTNSIVVLGDTDFISKVDEIIAKLDQPLDQVYVQALIMETTLNNSSQFGVEWLIGGGNNSYAVTGGYLNTAASGGSPLLNYVTPVLNNQSPSFSSLPSGFNVGVIGNVINFAGVRFPTLAALVNFLKTADGVNILSTPQIMTLDNAQAEVFVGSNIPYLTSQQTNTANSNTGIATQIYDYRDVGVRLKVVPHINRTSGLIRMDIEQEVKKLSGTTQTTQPTTLTRTTKTSVQLLEGSTMVISGLIENDNNKSRSAVPGLGDMPVLGWLFKSKSDSYQKSTLMIFITARIIRTQDQSDALTKMKMQENAQIREDTDQSMAKEYGGKSFIDQEVPQSLQPESAVDSFMAQPGQTPPASTGATPPPATRVYPAPSGQTTPYPGDSTYGTSSSTPYSPTGSQPVQ